MELSVSIPISFFLRRRGGSKAERHSVSTPVIAVKALEMHYGERITNDECISI